MWRWSMQPEEGDSNGGYITALRRTFLKSLGGLAAIGATVGQFSESVEADDTVRSEHQRRLQREYRTRIELAQQRIKNARDESTDTTHPSNARKTANGLVVSKFGKSLSHDAATGLPTIEAYNTLTDACERGSGFAQIKQASLDPDFDANDIDTPAFIKNEEEISPRPLVQPESAWTYLSKGRSPAQLEIARPPDFDSPTTGAEMVELYWRALTRDVKFHQYRDNRLIHLASRELNDIEGYRGPGSEVDRLSDAVDEHNVFRGIVPGAQTGPYVSQFLWKTRPLGGGPEDQRIQPQAATDTPRDYATTVEDWLKIQRGIAPSIDENLPGNEFSSDHRYIISGRDMAERVHDDPPFRQLQKAAQVLIFSMRAPLDPNIPYTLKTFEKRNVGADVIETTSAVTSRDNSDRTTDAFLSQVSGPFNDFGPLYIEKRVLEASEHGQKAAWHKKWNVHRRLRPEEYGGRIQAVKPAQDREGRDLESAAEYPIPDNLLNSRALEETYDRYGSYLLPQAYAEGSPTHPSYPAGHSVVAGAGVTVLKALFDGDHVIPADEKVIPTRDGKQLRTAAALSGTNTLARKHNIFDELTVRGELNKLAANMALGRNRAGIHYRSDGIEGLRLGESAAIQLLSEELSLPANNDSIRLSLTTFDGKSVTIKPMIT